MKNAQIFLAIFLLCASLYSFACAEETKTLTVRCLDGALLFQGKIENLNEIKHFLKDNLSVPQTVAELQDIIKQEPFSFTPSFEVYYETPPAKKTKTIFSMTLKEAVQKHLIPDIHALSPQDTKKLLHAFGMDVYFMSSKIGDSGVYTSCDITVESAGKLAGSYTANAPNGYAEITVNGTDVSTNKRGYNIAVINPVTCKAEASVNFDTRDEKLGMKYSQQMSDFIEKIAPGKIVAAAVSDEGSKFLTQTAVSALKTIGAKKSIIGYRNYSHAVLGVKGLAEGLAMEDMSTQSVMLTVTKGLFSPDEITSALMQSSGVSVFLSDTSQDSVVEIAAP